MRSVTATVCQVAVGLRLGAKLCEPHRCCIGASVDLEGTHSLDRLQSTDVGLAEQLVVTP